MTGVILFRAQPFHNGHLAQIYKSYEDMRDINSDLYVVVGSADKYGTKRNPFPIEVRLELINKTLEEECSAEQLQHIKVDALSDFSDEANNTHSWGRYLYNNLCRITEDHDFVFYYSDKPEIVLSWFPNHIRDHIWFRFLPRVRDICASFIRERIGFLVQHNQYDDTLLMGVLPKYVYKNIPKLKKYIINTNK